jgi:hypothetical protein
VKEGSSKKRRIKVRSYVEHVFFRAAHRAADRARQVRNSIDAGEIYPIPIAEEIEASAESIVLNAMCLEAYINGFVQDHLAEQASYIERMKIRAKWLLVPALLGKADCFTPGSQLFDNFSQLVKWRNDDLAHYKHEFRFPVSLGNLGTVSELYSICNADNSEQVVKTVREMIRRLNTCLDFPLPSWIQENISIDSWMGSVQTINKAHLGVQKDDAYIHAEMHVKVIPSDVDLGCISGNTTVVTCRRFESDHRLLYFIVFRPTNAPLLIMLRCMQAQFCYSTRQGSFMEDTASIKERA